MLYWQQQWWVGNLFVNKSTWGPTDPSPSYTVGGVMGHSPIQNKNGPLTIDKVYIIIDNTDIAILSLKVHWNFHFICKQERSSYKKEDYGDLFCEKSEIDIMS